MRFDVLQFLAEQNIEHRVGPSKNVKVGWVGVDCIFCGDDTGKHLGIHLTNGFYSCWRNPAHKGGLAYFVAAVLRCPLSAAKKLIGEETAPAPGGQSWAELAALNAGSKKRVDENPIKLFPEFKPLRDKTGAAKRFYEYLIRRRRFAEKDIPRFCQQYNIHYALTGPFAHRLIFPLYDEKGILRGWQGRPIGSAETRYLSYPSGPEVKEYIFNGQNLINGGENLFIVEGPVDCYKGDFYGGKENRFGAMLGVSYTPVQVGLLYRIAPRFKRRFVCFDKGALPSAMRLCRELSKFDFRYVEIPPGREDVGALRPGEVKPVLASLVAGHSYQFR